MAKSEDVKKNKDLDVVISLESEKSSVMKKSLKFLGRDNHGRQQSTSN